MPIRRRGISGPFGGYVVMLVKDALGARLARNSWRGLVSVALLIGYMTLAAEAIHCQYQSTPTSHHAHGSSDAASVNHGTHCLLANHGTSATLHSAAWLMIDSPDRTVRVTELNPILPSGDDSVSAPARAPPPA